MLRVSLIVACLLAAGESLAPKTWEFGKDVHGSMIVFQQNGIIRIWDKNIEIPIKISPCMKLQYVSTKVKNPLSTPKVTFNKHKRSIVIKYGIFQSSKSWYEVTAKATPTFCDSNYPTPNNNYPEPSYPSHSFDEPNYPQQNYPLPNNNYPEPSYPQHSFDEPNYPQQNYPLPNSQSEFDYPIKSTYPEPIYPPPSPLEPNYGSLGDTPPSSSQIYTAEQQPGL